MLYSSPLRSIIVIGLLLLLQLCTAFSVGNGGGDGRRNILDINRSPIKVSPTTTTEDGEWREYCNGCQRPLPQCLCDHLPKNKIHLQTHVLILQHPVEFRRKTISTVPLLKLVLENVMILVGRSFDTQLESIIQ